MAKKIDLSKLTLQPKKKINKPAAKEIDSAVNAIHAEEKNPVKATVKPAGERTKRVTLDIPVSLHKRIKARVFDLETTMKVYFLELAEMDLEQFLVSRPEE